METMTRLPLHLIQNARIILATALVLAAALPVLATPKRDAKHEMEIGFAAARNGYWQEALMRFERADALTPDQPHILNNLAVAREATGDFDGALLTYEKALEVAPGERSIARNYDLFKKFYQENVANPEAEPEPEPEPVPADDGDSATVGDVDQGGA